MNLPELSGGLGSVIRIPPELNVAVTPRVLALIDAPAMQRLRSVTQLGLVSHVYPGAVHSRFEHSLGVYRLACDVLKHLLASDYNFGDQIDEAMAKIFLVSALVHDVGHWPYCHPIEDMRLDWVPRHEQLAAAHLTRGRLAGLLQQDWQIDPQAVCDFLTKPAEQPILSILQQVLNGPVDVDKMDYLQRDSLHAGVPYGRNFDLGRLVYSLCVDWTAERLAITPKGKTAAEMLVFARYVMFSEVYWHHAVRSATAMLQRLVYSVAGHCSTELWSTQSDAGFAEQMLQLAARSPKLAPLAAGLFGHERQLYKRVAQYTVAESPDVFQAVGRRPYAELVVCAERLAELLSRQLNRPLRPLDILLDAPPWKLEVQFRLPIRAPRSGSATAANNGSFSDLSTQSPVVRSLATEQFDSFVKQVRVFVAADRIGEINIDQSELAGMLIEVASS